LTATPSGGGEPDESAATQALIVQVALAEFNKLREEIAGRSTAEWTLLGLNVTASATTVGLVIAYKADIKLLLLLPLLTPSLGMLVIDHAFNISRIGQYIRDILAPTLRKATGENALLGYESWVQAYERQTVPRLLPFGIPLILLFSGVPIGALVVAFPTAAFPTDVWGLWLLGLLATGVQVYFWLRILVPAFRAAIRSPAS
jgi:hypothetical protein